METELNNLPSGGGGATSNGSSTSFANGGAVPSAPKDKVPLLKSDSSASDSSPSVSGESLEELDQKYAPFVRRDVYGRMGHGHLPALAKVMLAVAAATLVPVRLVLGILILFVYYVICRVCTAFSSPNLEDGQEDYAHLVGWRREVIVRSGRFLSRAVLFVLGFYWIKESRRFSDQEEHGEHIDESEHAGAVVSNHISYIDILYHMSSSFPSFVAKRSVAKLPLVGLISKCLGCIYVQRESKSSDFKGVSGAVTERIQEVHRNEICPKMLLFPEGTTTNGDYLLPFKSGAFLAKAPVVPVILRYPYQRFSPAWDSISGVRHVLLLLCQFINYLEVIRLPVYLPSEQEKEDPKLYANNVRKLIAAEGNLKLSDIGLAEKRIYHAALNGNALPGVLHQKDD